ncbi:hypothetical protein ACJMK2_023378 [Sinanodonta woodiana]|uniref:Uncharacterized protein n=1 Tax=Sinanodonta woodiana TaxID=1069815 RepID=A0ABD3T413_SINWO
MGSCIELSARSDSSYELSGIEPLESTPIRHQRKRQMTKILPGTSSSGIDTTKEETQSVKETPVINISKWKMRLTAEVQSQNKQKDTNAP